MKWKIIKDENIENGKNVLICYKDNSGKRVIVIAAYFGQYELEACDDNMGDTLEYSEKLDEYFAPAGWYERCMNHPEYAYIMMYEDPPTHWMELPKFPD